MRWVFLIIMRGGSVGNPVPVSSGRAEVHWRVRLCFNTCGKGRRQKTPSPTTIGGGGDDDGGAPMKDFDLCSILQRLWLCLLPSCVNFGKTRDSGGHMYLIRSHSCIRDRSGYQNG